MTYNVFSGTLNATQSLNQPGRGDASSAYILRVIHQVSAPGVSTRCHELVGRILRVAHQGSAARDMS